MRTQLALLMLISGSLIIGLTLTFSHAQQQPPQQLEKELEEALKEMRTETPSPPITSPGPSQPRSLQNILNPRVSAVIDAFFKGSTQDDPSEFANANEFVFREAEINLHASIDPFAEAFLFTSWTPDEVSLEEGFILTTAFRNIAFKTPLMFTDFGKLNKVHDHDLPFVERPGIFHEFLNGQVQGTGLEVHYLFPTRQFIRASFGIYNEIAAHSHLTGHVHETEENGHGEGESENGHGHDENGNGHVHGEPDVVPDDFERDFRSFAYQVRLSTFFDLADDHGLEIGGSALFFDPDNRLKHNVQGIDLTYRWQPRAKLLYRGFSAGGELWFNQQEFDFNQDGFIDLDTSKVGFYAYGEAKVSRRWSLGFIGERFGRVEFDEDFHDINYGPYTTFWWSDFNRLRFQWRRRDLADTGGGGDLNFDEFFLQWSITLGPHEHSAL